MKLLARLAPLFLAVSTALAQTTDDSPAATVSATMSGGDAAAAGGMMALGIGCWLLSCGGGLALWLAIGIWVMKDAKRRNSPNATLVTVLAWIPATSVIGLIVHLVTRPKTIGSSTPPNP